MRSRRQRQATASTRDPVPRGPAPRDPAPRGRAVRAALATLVGLALLATACAPDDGGDRVTLDLFQFKPEGVGIVDELIADFEAEHPDIRVVQNHLPDADTALRVRLVREDVPDVLVLNGNFSYGEVARAGVFHDWAGDELVDRINPDIQAILDELGTREEGEVNGLAFASNADGIIYNADLFAEQGLEEPTTWDELVAVIEALQDADIDPFVQTVSENWTTLPAWNALAGNIDPGAFFDDLRAEETTFDEGFRPVAERLAYLFEQGQDDRFSTDYGTGNQRFAQGEAAMILQGTWAIPEIRSLGAEFELGVFPYPADDAEDTRLVSGVDVLLTMGRDGDHPEESRALIEYLLRPEVAERYAADQSAIPAVEGAEPDDPVLDPLLVWIEEGRTVGFAEHQMPPSIPLPQINQGFLIDGDLDAYLATLDREWAQYARRRP